MELCGASVAKPLGAVWLPLLGAFVENPPETDI